MKILDQLPITDTRRSLPFGGRYITVHNDQLLVWVSVHLPGVLVPEESIPKFPALLDTGNNVEFSIQDRHLREWAGIDPRLLESLREMRVNQQVVTLRKATVWLHPNTPGRQDMADDRPPFRLRLAKGIAVHAPGALPPSPRLPLLGLPAFLSNDLDWWLDPDRRHITVQTRTWRRSLIRLLCRV
jgi:hypothetical protein